VSTLHRGKMLPSFFFAFPSFPVMPFICFARQRETARISFHFPLFLSAPGVPDVRIRWTRGHKHTTTRRQWACSPCRAAAAKAACPVRIILLITVRPYRSCILSQCWTGWPAAVPEHLAHGYTPRASVMSLRAVAGRVVVRPTSCTN
jgi:hypothetical protein